MDAFTQDLDMNPQALTQEPKIIGSVARLTECPSVGWSVWDIDRATTRTFHVTLESD